MLCRPTVAAGHTAHTNAVKMRRQASSLSICLWQVRLTLADGGAVDRIPAWAARATVPPGQMGAKFDGVHWAPPQHERHQWCESCKRPVN